jgi:3-oxoacyl-[acyl-carrier-protein] synthase III
MHKLRSVITGTGSFVPECIKTNGDFVANEFYDLQSNRIATPTTELVEKFSDITGIVERRYANDNVNSSDMAVIAAQRAIEDAGIDPETLDQIIFAHNFGNVSKHSIQSEAVPALASRVKHTLKIKNPECVAYDILFGCPGWLQGIIQADAFIKAGVAKKCLIIGAETLSRVVDHYDRDSMIYSDGAGACVLEAKEDVASGIIGTSVRSDCMDEANFLFWGKSNLPESDPNVGYLKMHGRKVYEYAIKHVPSAMKNCLDKAQIEIKDLKKVFIHQANEKMDEGIIKAMYKLYDIKEVPEHIMPMSIHKLGNSSVATIPTVFDRVRRGEMENQNLQTGDVVLFASVGAGMNINAIAYRI